MRRRTQEDKGAIVGRILCNPTYLPEAGLIKNLRKWLMSQSYEMVSGLDIIIKLKTSKVLNQQETKED